MRNKKTKESYLRKLKEIKKHNNLYFNKNNPRISDSDYDYLKHEILNIEKKYPDIITKDSPSLNVGYKPSKSFKKIKHRIKMLSLTNIFSKDDLINFEKKIRNFLNFEQNYKIDYSVEPKIDGISASLTYRNGKLIYGVSRGDGTEGEVITENLKTIQDIPHFISNKDFPEDIEIRGEVFIENSDFEKINKNFANARNAASGSLRQKDSNETKKIPLRFIAYTYGYIKNSIFKTQSEFINYLKIWGFKVSEYNKIITGVDNLFKNHKNFENSRFNVNYDLDGLVYKINNLDLQKRLGFVANAPRWATAHKFSAKSSTSKILNIDIQVGRTGALTPVAKIKPVNIGGVTVSNATLHNEEEILRKDIRIGDYVKIERAGDVIPHVVSVDITKRNKKVISFVFPKKCPSCGSKVSKDFNTVTKKFEAVTRCTSEGYECEKMSIEKIKHFISKDALNIDGFGKKVVENFWNLKFIRYPYQIYELDFKKIENLDGWGKLSVSNLMYSIEKSKKVSLDKLIFALGIRHIGQENAKLISEYLKTIDNLEKIDNTYNFSVFLNIDGIGETQVKSIKNFFSNKANLKIIKKLKNYLNVAKMQINKSGKLNNNTFLITGKLNGISRAEAKSKIEQLSGKIQSSVNKNLNFLVIGDKPTLKKVNKAKEFNITLLDQEKFLKLIN